jgi:hypothetical protein
MALVARCPHLLRVRALLRRHKEERTCPGRAIGAHEQPRRLDADDPTGGTRALVVAVWERGLRGEREPALAQWLVGLLRGLGEVEGEVVLREL